MEDETIAVPSVSTEPADSSTQEVQSDQATISPDAPDPDEGIDLAALTREELDAYVERQVEKKAKPLQADYTRKTQEIADIRRKAAAFDELAPLLEKPDRTVTPPAPKPRMSGEDVLLRILDGGEDFLDTLIKDRAAALVEERVAPLSQAEATREADATISRLTAKYPDFGEHADRIVALLEASSYAMDVEQAYQLATWDKQRAAGMNEATRAAQQRTQAAGTTSGRSATIAPNATIRSVKDAFEAAKRQAGR